MRNVAIALCLGVFACSELFGDAVQCNTDADCASFANAVCDTTQGVCAPATASEPLPPSRDSGATVSPTHDDASQTVATDGPDPCAATGKPEATVGGAPTRGADGAPIVDIQTDTTLTCDKDWVLRGTVTVHAGATLSVQRGTHVKGESGSALLIEKGGKLVARGEKDAPVVFTSNKPEGARAPGDWRGLVIAGNAGPSGTLPAPFALPYGGGDGGDSSGALKYVRIEYAEGGVNLGGLGTGTELDFVQVRRPNDNCYAFYGGTANAKHLICQSPADEHFEFEGQYQGKLQFLIGQNTPTDTPNHNGILVNAAYPTIYNATLCGTAGANQGYGMLLRATAQGHFANTIVTGWNAGVDVVTTPGQPLELVSSIFFGNRTANIAYLETPLTQDQNDPTFDDDGGFDEIGWFKTEGSKNGELDPSITPACFDVTKGAFAPASALTTNAAAPPADGFFDPNATYIGAVRDGSDAWATGGWVVWSAQ